MPSRPVLVAVLGIGAVACSSEQRPRDAGREPQRAEKASPRPTRDAGPAREVWSGTFDGRVEPAPDAPPRAADAGPVQAWSGNGTVRFEVQDEAVTGTLEGGGMQSDLRGSLVAGRLRAWLRSDGEPGSVLMGRIDGALEGEAIKGTWRVSTSGGGEVRAGEFEARKDGSAN